MSSMKIWEPQSLHLGGGGKGKYSLLMPVGGNIALGSFCGGRHALISRMHLNNTHGAPDPGPTH